MDVDVVVCDEPLGTRDVASGQDLPPWTRPLDLSLSATVYGVSDIYSVCRTDHDHLEVGAAVCDEPCEVASERAQPRETGPHGSE
jgi:hypothetical protein